MISHKLKILLLNQCFYPDHVSTAQHLTDLALGLVAADHSVTVVASSRGYDNPEDRFPSCETWKGINIKRIWTPGLGKSSRLRRLIDFSVFWINAARILLVLPRHDVMVCLTSPPLISTLGTLISKMKKSHVIPWIMDLNPDEAVAAGWLKKDGLIEKFLTITQNWSLGRASQIVVLDRFMSDRVIKKKIAPARVQIIPPWSHDLAIQFDATGREEFRRLHGLSEKFVVMYSGNHSPCHPLDSLLKVAEQLSNEETIHFLFVGGGSEFKKVKQYAATKKLTNITCLPYQPIKSLSASLSSGDLHVVVMGEAFLGIVHPCKIYNIIAMGLPFLYIGPSESHVTDLAATISLPDHTLVFQQGDVEGILNSVLKRSKHGQIEPMDKIRDIAKAFSMEILVKDFIDLIEKVGQSKLDAGTTRK